MWIVNVDNLFLGVSIWAWWLGWCQSLWLTSVFNWRVLQVWKMWMFVCLFICLYLRYHQLIVWKPTLHSDFTFVPSVPEGDASQAYQATTSDETAWTSSTTFIIRYQPIFLFFLVFFFFFEYSFLNYDINPCQVDFGRCCCCCCCCVYGVTWEFIEWLSSTQPVWFWVDEWLCFGLMHCFILQVTISKQSYWTICLLLYLIKYWFIMMMRYYSTVISNFGGLFEVWPALLEFFSVVGCE